MSSGGITKENLLRLLPPALTRDKSITALAGAVAALLEARLGEIDRARVISNIDALPEGLLDILARDFKVDWWDPDYSLEEKRRTLKDSWRVHKTLGTKAAVERAISAIYPGTKVQEWFEYGGKPFYFRLSINSARTRTDTEKHAKVLERVNYYKSLRSHLDGFIWDFSDEPFVNEPDDFTLHRFVMALAFSDKRNFLPSIVFDGSALFDGAETFCHGPSSLFGFPRFEVSAAMAGLRGKLEQSGTVFSFAAFRTAEHVEMPEFRVRVSSEGTGAALSAPRFTAAATMARNRQNLSRATLTIDNLHTFGGEYSFDGSRRFDANKTQEEL